MKKSFRSSLVLTAAVAIASAALTRPALAVPPGAGWKRVFQDNFDGTKLTGTNWSKNYAQAPYNYLDHEAWMSPDQVKVSGGSMIITAIKQHAAAAPTAFQSGGQTIPLDYTSGAVNTKGKFSISGHDHAAYVEARIQVPSTIGAWPAFWLMPENGGWPPEIDVMEMPITKASDRMRPRYHYHYGPDGPHQTALGGTYMGKTDYSLAYHNYGVAWGDNYMAWYVDDKQVARINDPNIEQAERMYVILNLGVGGWAETPPSSSVFPSKMRVDWVRAYRFNGTGSAPLSFKSQSFNGMSTRSVMSSTPGGLAAVPEPGSVTAVLATLTTLRRPRRRK